MKREKMMKKMMKRKHLLLCTLAFTICSFSGVLAQEAGAGMIRELYGTVEYKTSASPDFVQAREGDWVWEDTIISTGFKSGAVLEVGSTLIALRPLTRLTLTEIRSLEGTENLSANLQAGRVRVDVTPTAGTRASVSVSNPTATASVRGTSFELDTQNLHVNEGTVSIAGISGQRIAITAGANITLGESGKARNPVATGSAALMPKSPGATPSDQGTIPASAAAGTGDPGKGGADFFIQW